MPDFEGPLTLGPARLESIVALANRVFRGAKGDMGREYPLLFRPDRMEQLRVITCEDKPVSLVGCIINDVTLLGCPLRICSVGSVCTDDAARGQGLAGRLVDDAVERSAAAGASVMLISGGRSLYVRRGAYSVGQFSRYSIPVSQLPAPVGLSVSDLTVDDVPALMKLMEGEPIRYRLVEDEYVTIIRLGRLYDQKARLFSVERDGRPLASIAVTLPKKIDPAKPAPPTAVVRHVAGVRAVLPEALKLIAPMLEAEQIDVEGYASDVELASVMSRASSAARPIGFVSGTIKLLNPQRLWNDFLPLLQERIGAPAGEIKLSWQADELKVHTLKFELAGQSLEIRGDQEVMATMFGSSKLDPLGQASGPLATLLRKALPLPTVLYGLNYV